MDGKKPFCIKKPVTITLLILSITESVLSGAQLYYPQQFNIDPADPVQGEGRNEWLVGLVNGAPYVSISFTHVRVETSDLTTSIYLINSFAVRWLVVGSLNLSMLGLAVVGPSSSPPVSVLQHASGVPAPTHGGTCSFLDSFWVSELDPRVPPSQCTVQNVLLLLSE